MKIKICGITTKEDAMNCVEMGVDALGFNFFAGSSRYLSPTKAQEICQVLPPFVSIVGVFVNSNVQEINDISAHCNLDYVQLHGDETPEFCSKLNLKIIKALRVQNETDLHCMESYQGLVTSLLLDAKCESAYGGTGKIFDWAIALRAKQSGLPVILSGGLNRENIEAAIKFVNPYGVDICSGVEKSPGIKDFNKLERLVSLIRNTKV
jgi:phosphoribosylanthranilate isomerase